VVVAQPVINLHSTLQTPSLDLVFAAVAAAGTLILACATAWLAHQTTALARSTSSDVAAQFRPALVSDVDQAPEPYGQDGTLRLRIKNSGHGPALDIKARVPTNEVTAAPWHRGSLAAGDSVLLEFPLVAPKDQRVTATLAYRSLGGETYTSTIVVKFDDEVLIGTPDVVVEDVNVEVDPKSGSRKRRWLLC
jgi:hypothetical protein